MNSRDENIAWLMELLSPVGRITARRMFGGTGLYADGRIVGLEIGGALYLKTDEETRAHFERAGSAAFVFEGKGRPVTMSYWSAPDDAMDSPEAMRPWALLALAAAQRSEAAKAVKDSGRKRRR